MSSHKAVVDPGEGPWGSAPPPRLLFDQTETRRAEKNFLKPAPRFSQGLDDPPPPVMNPPL